MGVGALGDRPPPQLDGTANRWLTSPAAADEQTKRFFEDYGVWKDAPVLTGSTRFEPLPNVKNIMITGGAGFM